MQNVSGLTSGLRPTNPVTSPGLVVSVAVYEHADQVLVFSEIVPHPPRGVSVTPSTDEVGVMSPGAEALQLVMLSDQAPAAISSWSTVNSTSRVASMGVQHPEPN